MHSDSTLSEFSTDSASNSPQERDREPHPPTEVTGEDSPCAIAVEVSGSLTNEIGPDGTDSTKKWLLDSPVELEAYKRDQKTVVVVADGSAVRVERDGPLYRCEREECPSGGERASASACIHRAVASATVPGAALCECGSPFVIQSINAASPGLPDGQQGRKNTYFCAECGAHTETDVVSPGGRFPTSFKHPTSSRLR